MKVLLYPFSILISLMVIVSCSDKNPDGFIQEEKEILSQVLNLPEYDLDYSIRLPNHLRHTIPQEVVVTEGP